MTNIPDFPFFAVTAPEHAFGAEKSRFLPITKEQANALIALLSKEAQAAQVLFDHGALTNDMLAGRELLANLDPKEVRETTFALLKSRIPSHEVKIATCAVALNRWFPAIHKMSF